MQDAARARVAATDAVADIGPERLREVIDARLVDCSVVPGVLTVLSARVCASEADADAVDDRAAGVQLVYEGLRLTRQLVHDDPWTPDPPADIPADVDVVAADVLVARGFRLLAHTEAAPKAVETVRAFGRSETDRRAGRGARRHELEANVFELAAVAGATVGGAETPLPLRQYVVGLAHSAGDPPLGPTTEALPESVEDVMGRVTADGADAVPARSANRND